jgi:hypothetical protein
MESLCRSPIDRTGVLPQPPPPRTREPPGPGGGAVLMHQSLRPAPKPASRIGWGGVSEIEACAGPHTVRCQARISTFADLVLHLVVRTQVQKMPDNIQSLYESGPTAALAWGLLTLILVAR